VIGLEALVAQLPGISREDVERWIIHEWVRPDPHAGGYIFYEIDVARAHLIRELRSEMRVNDDAMPVVLALLDQLYDLRRHMRAFSEAVGETVPDDMRLRVAAALLKRRPA
jgi:chaperone modulatory protein CbpM